MIIEKALAKGDIVGLKLSSGEELLGRYEETTSEHVVVSKPLTVVIMPDPQGGMPGVGYMQFSLTMPEDATIRFTKNAVLFVGKARPEATAAYQRRMSPVVVPQGGLPGLGGLDLSNLGNLGKR